MPYAIVAAGIGVAGSIYSSDQSRKAQNKASGQNDALAQQQFDEDKRRYDADREDKWTLFNAQMAGDEELDRRNRADKERAYQRGAGLNKGNVDRGELAGNRLAFLMGLGQKRGGTAATAASAGVFDGAAYLAANPDVAADSFFGQNPEEHYRRHGKNEGRAAPMTGATAGTEAIPATEADNADYGWLSKQFGMDDFVKDPGYQFGMDEGQKNLGNQFAASGSMLSGAAMKALNRFNTDYAGTKYNEAYSRFNNDQDSQYNRLAGIQGAGQNAINSTNGLASTVQGSGSNAMSGLANALGQSSAQFGASSNNYYNNLMGNNNARANSQSSFNSAFGNQLGSGLGSIAGAWNTYQRNNNNNNYSYPTSNFGGYDDQGF